MAELPEGLEEEFEALDCTYGDELHLPPLDALPLQLSFDVVPRTGDDSSSVFVQVVLQITVTNEYPNSSPTCALTGAKGLSDGRVQQLLSALELEAQHMAGGCKGLLSRACYSSALCRKDEHGACVCSHLVLCNFSICTELRCATNGRCVKLSSSPHLRLHQPSDNLVSSCNTDAQALVRRRIRAGPLV